MTISLQGYQNMNIYILTHYFIYKLSWSKGYGIKTKQAKLAIEHEQSKDMAKAEFKILTKQTALSAEIVGQC